MTAGADAPGTRLLPAAAGAIRGAIFMAGGREVCFVGTVDDDGAIATARVVARGDATSVLALPGFAQRGELLIHNHPSGVLDPSEPDLQVAAGLHDNGIGFAIVNNGATELYVVVEVPRHQRSTLLTDVDVADALGPDGSIATMHPRYEDRDSQRAYATTIADLYNAGGVGLLEAGTGVGKSLGYLVPALRWAHLNGERTIVSTNTINLQEQLVRQDLPFLAGALSDQKVRFALLKGWRNYLCLLRLEHASGAGTQLFEEGPASELAAIAAWAGRTSDGSLADLPTPPRPEVWDEVAAEPDLCLRMKCPLFDDCFLFKARRVAAQADVIVVNHHLLMADLAVRRASQNWDDAAVLPAYQRLVIDEGHHIEDAAAQHLGATVTRRALQRLFGRLERKGKGLLPALAGKLAAEGDLLSVASLQLVESRIAPAVRAGREHADLVFDLLGGFLDQSEAAVVRLTDRFAQHPVWRGGLDKALRDVLAEFNMMEDGLRLVRERLETDTAKAEQLAPLLNEMRGVARRLQSAGDALRRTLRPEAGGEPSVRWVEVKGREKNIGLSAVPLDLAPVLRDDLFARATTTIVTSATLATNGRFDFLASRLGVVDVEPAPVTGVFPSPFDYATQALLAIPIDLPAPNVDAAGHFARVMEILADLLAASDGGVFALFTSHRDVRQAATELRARRLNDRWPVLVHGEEPRDALLARFRQSGDAVLLGTASFWEGVDVPGRALRALLLPRLPFRVPTDPVTAAQCEAIEARGGDPFREYMLPHAALRLKQGFGRLIRSSTDRGVVVLADPRVATKNYGASLRAGLPPASRAIGRWADIVPRVERFFAAPTTQPPNVAETA